MAIDLKIGDVVRVNAGWAPIQGGTVTAISENGFKVDRWWFGWHELAGPPLDVNVILQSTPVESPALLREKAKHLRRQADDLERRARLLEEKS